MDQDHIKLRNEIEVLFENKAVQNTSIPESVVLAMDGLDQGIYRVVEINQKRCFVHEWLKKAILLYFRYSEPVLSLEGLSYDKVPLKFLNWKTSDFETAKIRIVPGAVVRYGAFLDQNVVIMNSFINVGAFIGQNTMIDSFATVGSCAYIGKSCHISAGCVVGGVLEPVEAAPVIIEDDCFIGAQSAVVEGVTVHKGATLAMGTRLGRSTKIIDRNTGQQFIREIPENAVVVPGSYFSHGCSISCAVIVRYKHQKKKFITQTLRFS